MRQNLYMHTHTYSSGGQCDETSNCCIELAHTLMCTDCQAWHESSVWNEGSPSRFTWLQEASKQAAQHLTPGGDGTMTGVTVQCNDSQLQGRKGTRMADTHQQERYGELGSLP